MYLVLGQVVLVAVVVSEDRSERLVPADLPYPQALEQGGDSVNVAGERTGKE